MTIIGCLFGGMILLAIGMFLFYLMRKVIIIAAFLSGLYLIFLTEYLELGCLMMVVWLVLASVSEKSKEKVDEADWFEDDAPAKRKKRKAAPSGGGRLNTALMWLIPLFWPILIFRTFFRDKQVGKLDAYDYEQHIKSNGK